MKTPAIVCFTLLLTLFVGCTTQEPGIYKSGGAYYEWTQASVAEVSDATFAALREQPNIVVLTQRDANTPPTEIRAVNRYGTAVTVYISDEDGATSYGVEIDPGESEGYSLTILNAIRRQLGESDRK